MKKKLGIFFLIIVVLAGTGVGVYLLQRQTQIRSKADTVDNPVLNVRDFGARADGATDDTYSIQSAINQARQSGAAIYFPPGYYRVTSLDLTDASNMHLIGASQRASKLIAIGNTNTVLDLTGSSHIKFEQLSLGFLSGVAPETGVMLASSVNHNCEDITFDNFWVSTDTMTEGAWKKAAVYIYGCKNIIFQHATLVGRHGFKTILTASTRNDLRMASNYTTMAFDIQPTGDISFLLTEIHNYLASATAAISLSGVNNVRLMGGPFSSVQSPQFFLKNGVSNLAVYGTTMYTERDVRPNYQVWIDDKVTVNGLKIDQATCTNEKAIIGGVTGVHLNNLYVNCTPYSQSKAMFDFQLGETPHYVLTNSFVFAYGLSVQGGGSIDGTNQVVY